MGFLMQGVHFEELGTEELNIPSLSARRTKLADGSLRVLILVCKSKWNKELKQPRVISSQNVGVVADNKEFGPIVFKEAFLQQYPQLRDVTVLRKESHKYVYIKTPLKLDAHTVGYHKVGRQRYEPPTAEGKTKLYGATMLCSKVAEHFNLKRALIDAFGRLKATRILSIAIALLVLRQVSLSSVKHLADYVFLGTEKVPLSSPAITKLCKGITSGLGRKYFGLVQDSLYKQFPCLESALHAVDGTSVPSYSRTNPRVEYGHPKKDNPGIPQFNLIFIAHMLTGIPCYFRELAGNVPDKSAYKHDSDYCCSMLKASAHLRDELALAKRMIHVFDRGYSTRKVMQCATEHNFDFVCRLTNSMKETKEARAYAAAHNIEDKGDIIGDAIRHMALPECDCPTITSTLTGCKKRLFIHVYYDLSIEVQSLLKLLDLGSSIIAAHKTGTYDKLSKTIRDLDGRIKLVPKRKDGKWCVNIKAAKEEAAHSALKVLGCTLKEMEGQKVLDTYTNREKVELAIRSFKGLGFARLGSGNTETMFGRLFLFFVSTQIEMGLLYLAKQAKDGHGSREPNAQEKHILSSMPELITLMNGITCDVCGKDVKVHEIVGLRRGVLELLGLPVVASSDDDADDESQLEADLTDQALAELYTQQDAAEEGLRIR